MRYLLALAIMLTLAVPALAGPTVKVSLDGDTVFTLSVNPKFQKHVPDYMGFKVASRQRGELIETKGDPLIYFGGKLVGQWPYAHATYVFKSGTRITGHATSPNGNPQSFEIVHPNGTMTLIRKADTLKPQVQKLSKIQAMAWRAMYERKTFELIVD